MIHSDKVPVTQVLLTLGFLALGLLMAGAFTVLVIIKGNFYFDEDSVLDAIQNREGSPVTWVRTERSIFSRSEVAISSRNGDIATYFVDSNILFDYILKRE